MENQINSSPSKNQQQSQSIITSIHAGYFRITLSLGWQALLWKIILQPHNDSLITFRVPKLLCSAVLTAFWSFSLLVLLLLSLIYSIRCLRRLDAVKAEFAHRVGVNYLFAPWISWLLILESAPFVAPARRHHVSLVVLWWAFAVPVVVLDVKIYGQWFTTRGGRRFLTAVANPTSQLSVVGNLVGARAAAKMGWNEVAIFLFALGMAHYLVLFVTLYQRIPGGGDRIPAVLRPVLCLYFAAPSVASLAWYSIAGRFDTAAKMLFSLSLFLFASLMCRPSLFRKAMRRFSIAWWAYSYPITMLALASIRYEQEVKGGVSRAIRHFLSLLSLLVLFALLLFTAFNPKLLLPDDRHDHPMTSLPDKSPSSSSIIVSSTADDTILTIRS